MHRLRASTIALTVLVAGSTVAGAAHVVGSASFRPSPPTPAATSARQAMAKLPLRFEPNRGQTDPQVSFLARAGQSTLFLTPTEAVMTMAAKEGSDVLRMSLRNANPLPVIRPLGRQAGTTNYLVGSDRSQWRTGIEGWSKVQYDAVYPGIDAVFHGTNGAMEYDFDLAPGADPMVIAMAFAGRTPSIDGGGGLVLSAADAGSSSMTQPKPTIYQVVGGVKRPVEGSFALRADGTVGFDVGAYDHTRELVIDPVLGYSTYLGGSGEDAANAVAVDAAGNAYVAGQTTSTDFPVASAYQPTAGGNVDAVVTKIDPNGASLIFSTYLGGYGDDIATGIGLDGSNSPYLTGQTKSNFPTTAGAFDANRTVTDGATTVDSPTLTSATANFTASDVGRFVTGANIPSGASIVAVVDSTTVTMSDSATLTDTGVAISVGGRTAGMAFAAKLDASGSSLAYSTYLGGAHGSSGMAIAVSGSGSAYVVGAANSDFPTTVGAFSANRTFADGVTTSGVATFTSATASFTDADIGRAITGTGIPADTTIAARTDATTVVLSANATASATGVSFTLGGQTSDTFVSALSSSGGLTYSTYLGPTTGDHAGIALSSGMPVVTRATNSARFPVTAGAYDTSCGTNGLCNGTDDAVVAKVDPSVVGNGSGTVSPSNAGLVFSTFLGGDKQDLGNAIAADSAGDVYVTGSTQSAAFPVTSGSFGELCETGCDGTRAQGFVTKLSLGGSALAYSGYLDGNTPFGDQPGGTGFGIAVDSSNSAFVTGITYSADFPVVSPIQYYQGNLQRDAFVTQISTSGTSLVFSTYLGGADSDFGNGIAVGPGGSAIVAGFTYSADYNVTPGALQPTCASVCTEGVPDGFVTRLNPGVSPPAIKSLSPAAGPASGSTEPVTITGGNFTGATAVTFGGVPATSFIVVSDTSVQAFAPPQAEGTVAPAVVTTPTGSSTDNSKTYTYMEGGVARGPSCVADCGSRSVTLNDGRILVVDAGPAGAPLPAEIYDPATRVWAAAGSCNGCDSAAFQGAQPLVVLKGAPAQCGTSCGKVLWAGGRRPGPSSTPTSNEAYLFDPATGTWTQTGDMVEGHLHHGMIQLPSGKVLVAGGCATSRSFCGPSGGTPFERAELFDPLTGTWSATGAMAETRADFPLIYLDPAVGNCGTDCGKVLAAGGRQPFVPGTSGVTAGAELYDPATGTWASAPSMAQKRFLHLGFQLPSGNVLEVGGYSGYDSSELYDPATRTWSTPASTFSGLNHVGAVLPNGKVLADGSYENGTIPQRWLYNSATDSWKPLPVTFDHTGGNAVALPQGPLSLCGTDCGKVMLIGGSAGLVTEFYTPAPAVASVSATGGAVVGGTNVTITGTGLASVAKVTFGGVDATGLTHDATSPDTKLTVTSPAHAAGRVDLVVGSPGGFSAVSSSSRFTYGMGTVADFDNDARTDVSVLRASGGTWFAHPSAGGADTATGWGATGDIAVTGDYDGDGRSDQAIYRPSSGLWAIHKSSGGDSFTTYGGIAGDVPVAADYDGDRRADIAIFRPSVGAWYIHRSSDDADVAFTFGVSGDVPVVGDYDGDAKADIALLRGGTWFVHPSAGGPDTATGWGTPGDIPVPTDFDGDGRVDLAIFRPDTGLWAVHHSSGASDRFVTYGGIGGDVPVAADYDGDGRADIAIFRPSTGAWYVNRSTDSVDAITTFGIATDVPLPIPVAIRSAFF